MFRVRPPVALQADGDEGGMRFRIHCLLAGTDLATLLRSVGTAVFAERARQPWPPPLDPPPSAWAAYWDGEGRARHGLPNVDLAGAFDLLSRFWTPVLDASHVETWRPSIWAWH